MDRSRCSRSEIGRAKEDAGGENRQEPQAHRGRNATESIQYGIVARLARLSLQFCVSATNPAAFTGARGFFIQNILDGPLNQSAARNVIAATDFRRDEIGTYRAG